MTQGLSGFLVTWAPALASTMSRVEMRNIRQGGNDFLAVGCLAHQCIWAGSLMAEVAGVVSGPFYGIAKFFSILFNPITSASLSGLSYAVKGGVYESSVRVMAEPSTRFYQIGAPTDREIKGTVTLRVDGVDRYFVLGKEIDMYINDTILDGGKRYRFDRLGENESFDDRCREVDLNGERVRIRLIDEVYEKKYVQREENGQIHYFEILNEVEAPILGTTRVDVPFQEIDWDNPVFRRDHLLIEIPQEIPGCIKISNPEQILYYDTGEELSGPEPGAKTFIIDGQERYFRTAKYARRETVGLSGFINLLTQKFIGCNILPVRFSKIVKEGLIFAYENLSEIVRVAIVVAGAVLLFFGHTAMAAGALLALTYEMLDHDLGVIPQKVSLFIEKWMPTISMMGLLIVGSPITQIMAGGFLLLQIPVVQTFVHHKVSKVVRKAMLSIMDPLIMWFGANIGERRGVPPQVYQMVEAMTNFHQLEECEAPFVQQKNMNGEQIREILQGNDREYEINPPSLTRDVRPLLQLEENHNFGLLMDLWAEIGARWIQEYPRLLKRLADDKRFIVFLRQRFPEARRFYFELDRRNNFLNPQEQYQRAWGAYETDIEGWIDVLAQEQNISKEQFVVNYLQDQLRNYVDKISGNRPIEGEQKYLEGAIANTSKILPFLLRPDVQRIDLEDAMLKLAVEGGNYCSLAMWRASNEVLQTFTAPMVARLDEEMDPNQRFENEIMRGFQEGRLRAMQGAFQEIMRVFRSNEQLQDTSEDVHIYMSVLRSLKRGFYPLTEEEQKDFSMLDLLLNETVLLPARALLMAEVFNRIPDAMNFLGIYRETGRSDRIVNFLRRWVEQNPNIVQADREALLNGPLNNDEEHLADHENYVMWNRLILVVLGIFRKKAMPPAVEPIPGVPRNPPDQGNLAPAI